MPICGSGAVSPSVASGAEVPQADLFDADEGALAEPAERAGTVVTL